MKNRTFISLATVVLLEAELFIIVASWICSVLFPDSGIVSMISSEGVRWIVGSYANMLSTPYLIYIILIGMTVGIVQRSGLLDVIRNKRISSGSSDDVNNIMTRYSERLAIRLAVAAFVVGVIVISLLTFVPHAILINSNGDVFDSSFSRGFIPMICLVISVSAGIYGLCTSHITFHRSIADAFTYGIARIAPVILLYILIAQIYFTIEYII